MNIIKNIIITNIVCVVLLIIGIIFSNVFITNGSQIMVIVLLLGTSIGLGIRRFNDNYKIEKRR